MSNLRHMKGSLKRVHSRPNETLKELVYRLVYETTPTYLTTYPLATPEHALQDVFGYQYVIYEGMLFEVYDYRFIDPEEDIALADYNIYNPRDIDFEIKWDQRENEFEDMIGEALNDLLAIDKDYL